MWYLHYDGAIIVSNCFNLCKCDIGVSNFIHWDSLTAVILYERLGAVVRKYVDVKRLPTYWRSFNHPPI
jgi:hypothetical protein